MTKIRFAAYLMGVVLLFSSFNVQKCADALQKAYEEKDYDAFVDAFPNKYEDFVNVYGYDHENRKPMVLCIYGYEHIKFLFSDKRVEETNVLDKILSLSYNYIWDGIDAICCFIDGVYQLLLDNPHRMIEYFSKKTDEEVISFLQLSITNIDSDNTYYIKDYNKLIDTYTPYSSKIVRLLKIAFERAKRASEILVVY